MKRPPSKKVHGALGDALPETRAEAGTPKEAGGAGDAGAARVRLELVEREARERGFKLWAAAAAEKRR